MVNVEVSVSYQLSTRSGGEPGFENATMNNFTPRAQQVLALASKEAERFNHNYVGTEHLLLGLIKLGQGVAVNVLQRVLVQNFLSVCFYLARGFADFKRPGPQPKFPERCLLLWLVV